VGDDFYLVVEEARSSDVVCMVVAVDEVRDWLVGNFVDG